MSQNTSQVEVVLLDSDEIETADPVNVGALMSEGRNALASINELSGSLSSVVRTFSEKQGAERAVEAIEFGVDIRGAGFNLFALGPPGVGKHQLVTRILSERSGGDAQLWDWCYVSNFSDPQRPRLLRLEPLRLRPLSSPQLRPK